MPRRKQTEGEKNMTSARWLKTLRVQDHGIPCFGQWPCQRSDPRRVVQYAKEKNYVPICWHAGW